MRTSEQTSVLIVDDDEPFRRRLGRALRDRGYDVREAADADQALESAQHDSPEMAVVDLRMPGRSGMTVLQELRALDPATRVLMVTGYGSIANTVEAMRLGAVGYISKPVDADEILAAFARAAGEPSKTSDAEPVAPSLARAEWEHINRILADCEGNLSEAARRLGLHRRSLQRKLARYAPREPAGT
jgi:two-component system response regulator RegA